MTTIILNKTKQIGSSNLMQIFVSLLLVFVLLLSIYQIGYLGNEFFLPMIPIALFIQNFQFFHKSDDKTQFKLLSVCVLIGSIIFLLNYIGFTIIKDAYLKILFVRLLTITLISLCIFQIVYSTGFLFVFGHPSIYSIFLFSSLLLIYFLCDSHIDDKKSEYTQISLQVFSIMIFAGMAGVAVASLFSVFKSIRENNRLKREEDINIAILAESNDIEEKLETFFSNSKEFLNHTFKLSDLAQSINVPEHKLSNFLNQEGRGGFYQVLGTYRVKMAIKLIEEKGNRYTLNSIKDEVGFSSYNSFVHHFERVTGVYPSEYKQS